MKMREGGLATYGSRGQYILWKTSTMVVSTVNRVWGSDVGPRWHLCPRGRSSECIGRTARQQNGDDATDKVMLEHHVFSIEGQALSSILAIPFHQLASPRHVTCRIDAVL